MKRTPAVLLLLLLTLLTLPCLALAEDSIAHNPMQFAAVCRPLELEEYRALIGEMFDLSLIR